MEQSDLIKAIESVNVALVHVESLPHSSATSIMKYNLEIKKQALVGYLVTLVEDEALVLIKKKVQEQYDNLEIKQQEK